MFKKLLKKLLRYDSRLAIRKRISPVSSWVEQFMPVNPRLEPSPPIDIQSEALRCWTSDPHVFAVQSIKHQLKHLNVAFYDYCLSGDWPLFYKKDPTRGLRVLDRINANMPYDYAHYAGLGSRFARAYGKWSRKNVDFFWCGFQSYLAQVVAKCERPIVAQLFFRFEGNKKSTPDDIQKLIELFLELRSKGQLTVLSSNPYDQEYFDYFTGTKPRLVPFSARHIKARYAPHQDEILIGPARNYDAGTKKGVAIKEFFAKSKSKIQARSIRELYPSHHDYSDLCGYKAIIALPYTVCTGAIAEYLAMGIPLFMPTSDLLSKWHVDDYMLVERKSDLEPAHGSIVQAKRHAEIPDPNNDYDLDSVKYWLKFCEWYRWPIEFFDSFEELEHKLLNANFEAISQRMLAWSQQQHDDTNTQWRQILKHIRRSPYANPSGIS